MPETPRIEPDTPSAAGAPGVLIRAPYRPQLVDALKAELAPEARYWDPARGGWWVAAACRDAALAILLRFFPSVLLVSVDGADDELVSRDGSRAVQGRLL